MNSDLFKLTTEVLPSSLGMEKAGCVTFHPVRQEGKRAGKRHFSDEKRQRGTDTLSLSPRAFALFAQCPEPRAGVWSYERSRAHTLDMEARKMNRTWVFGVVPRL